MKKLNFTICLALAIMAFSSCSEDKTIPDGGTPPTDGVTVVTASADNNGTRTTLNNKSVFWSAGDMFTAFPNSLGSAALKFELTGDPGARTGAFTAEGTFGAGQRYAFYPYDRGVTIDTDVVSFVLPQTQSYVANSFGNGANPAVATSTDDTFAFKNLCGLLQIKLTGNGKVESIDITSDQNISGAATTTFGDTPVITMVGTDAANKTITLDCGDGVALHATNETSFYVVIPPTTHVLNIKINRTDGKEIDETVVIGRNQIKAMTSVEMDLVFGFNYYGVANSVIVPSASVSGEIDATAYILTGDDFMYQNNAGTTTATKAELVWEDTNNMITNVVYTPGTQKITFDKAAGAIGNAMIALYNAADEVVWSFHVWVPEIDPTTALKTYAVTLASNTYEVFPLNLGATHVLTNEAGEVKVNGVGLYYQWGRKDPLGRTAHSGMVFQPVYKGGAELTDFFIGEGIKDITVVAPYGIESATLDMDMINYAIKNPATFVFNNSDTATKGNWIGKLNDKLWGNPIGHKIPYPVATSIKKSIFDPCPEGYMITPRDLYLNFSTTGAENVAGDVINSPNNDTNGVDKGWNFYYAGNKTGEMDFYVKTGNRDWQTGNIRDVHVLLHWTSTPYSTTDSADKHGGCLLFSTWAGVLGGYQRGDGMNIRCVKIQK